MLFLRCSDIFDNVLEKSIVSSLRELKFSVFSVVTEYHVEIAVLFVTCITVFATTLFTDGLVSAIIG